MAISSRFWLAAIGIAVVVTSLLSLWAATTPPQPPTTSAPRRQTPKPVDTFKVSMKDYRQFDGACPTNYPSNHGLKNTGRKALVLYTFTSHDELYDRQVEIDNFLYFRTHGMLPPNTATALFSSVDYVVATSDMDRSPSNGSESGSARNSRTTTRDVRVHDMVQCAAAENVKVLEAPNGPCDLCVHARVMNALGGPEAIARTYEFIMFINSGARGPFFTETFSPPESSGLSSSPSSPPPVTWIDHFALGGEKVYTGAIMTGTIGTAWDRPYLTSFVFGFPASAIATMHPVLAAGCSDAPIPKYFHAYLRSYDADLHTTETSEKLIEKLKHIRDHPEILRSTPRGQRDAAARTIDDQVAAGATAHHARAIETLKALDNPSPIGPWPERKMKCVYRSEVQLMKTILSTPLPPEIGANVTNNSKPPTARAGHPSSDSMRRPKLTPRDLSLLSPAVAGYLHEGHYFARSLHHERTVVNMGHGLLLKQPGSMSCGCGEVFSKYGGVMWRGKNVPRSCMLAIQTLTVAQPPRRLPPAKIDVGSVLGCPKRESRIEPFR